MALWAESLCGFRSYKIDNSVDFSTLQVCRILLNLNGRGERIRTSDPLLPNRIDPNEANP